MNPVNVDGLAQYLGPGTGGLFMGEQQRNAMQESEINQQKGLEDIMTQQQTRDIQKQKLPFELQLAEQNALKAKGDVAKQATDAQDRLDKLDKQNVTDFVGAVLQYQGVDNPLDNAFQLQDLAKKYKLDGNDPRIRSIMTNSMDKQGIAKMQRALIESDPKWQADRKKAEEEEAKAKLEAASRERVGAGNNAATLGAAQIGADSRQMVAALRGQASGKLASIEQELVRLNGEYEKAPDKETKAAIAMQAQRLINAKKEITTAVAENNAAKMQQILSGAPVGGNTPPAFGTPPATTPAAQPAAPPPELAPALQKAGWSYEPEKYDYRVGPNGQLQRKPKGQ
jgi:hypothetical protein